MIVKNLPVTSVEDNDYCIISNHTFKISYKRICMMLFLLGKVVEEKTAEWLKNKHAIVIYDG